MGEVSARRAVGARGLRQRGLELRGFV